MSSPTPDQVIDALNWRYATKAFDPSKKIPAETWAALEASMILSPSSFGLEPWKFVVVNDPAVREKLKAAAWNQGQVTDASHLVVFAGQSSMADKDVDRLIQATADVRGTSVESLEGYSKMMKGFIAQPGWDAKAWASRQVYIALGFLLETAALLNVDACPMEGFNPKAFDEILGLPELGYNSVVMCTLGYRSANDKYASAKKVRYMPRDVIRVV